MSDNQGRLPLLAPGQLEEGQRDLYEAVAGGPRASGPFSVTDEQGRLLGPFNALLYAPAVGSHVERLGAALRFDGTLVPRIRELVICAVAAHWNSAYEWYAHSRVARAVGVSEAELASLRGGVVPEGLCDAEVAALRLVTTLLRDRTVGDDVYESVAEHHGRSGLVEICTVVGYYQLLAGVLAAADVGAPAVEDREGS